MEMDDLIDDFGVLGTPPLICLKLLDLVEDESAGAVEIGELIGSDPSLSARLLKLVNSAWYGLPSRVDTISRAVTIVGTEELVSLSLAASAVSVFSKIDPGVIDMSRFWRHSLSVAFLAKKIGSMWNVLHPGRLFTCGVLHDIGSLVLYRKAPEELVSLLSRSGPDEGRLASLEYGEYGFSHASLGAAMATKWRLPEHMIAAIRRHHDPGDDNVEVEILALAELIANVRDDSAAIGGRDEDRVEIARRAMDMCIRAGLPDPDLLLGEMREVRGALEGALIHG